MTEPQNQPTPPNNRTRNAMGGGIFLPIFIAVGIGVGIAIDQISAGMIGGLLVGGAFAIAIWIIDKRRR